jgi:PAS domain S-box-containing protein/putative nucleotidyltransferase with HDIG domain
MSTIQNKDISILIVEDSPTQAVMLESLLADQGYRVVAAGDGLKALEILKREKPNLIVSDIVMPNMDGYELCRAVKSDPALKDIPVILLTALTEPAEVINGLKSGADNFINKPYKKDFLLSQISNILANRELRKSRYFEVGIEILFAGEKHYITSDRVQIVDLLMSTFENAVVKNQELNEANRELNAAHEELRRINESLEETVRARTARITHLNDFLRAVRGINRLIVRERDPGQLIQEACDTIVQTRGYDAAWIALVDPEAPDRITAAAESLSSREVNPMIDLLRAGALPPCTEGVRRKPGSILALNRQSPECATCLYTCPWKTGTSLTTDISYGGKLHGYLSMNISSPMVIDEEEEGLILEMAGDIGFALHDIDLERAHEKTFEELQKSEAQYRLHFENVSDVIFSIDRSYRITSITPSVKAILGYEPEQVIAKELHKLKVLTESSLSAAMFTLQLVFSGEHAYPAVYELIAHDGTSRFLEILSSPIMENGEATSVLSIGRDITERKVAEDWLLKQRTMTERIMQTTPSGIMLFDREGNLTFVNPRGCEILGIPLEMVQGRKRRIDELHLKDSEGREIPGDRFPSSRILAEGRPIHGVDLSVRISDGRNAFLSVNGAPILDTNGNIQEVVLTFDDITDRKEAEDRLEETLQILRQAVNTTIQVLALAVESKDPYTAGHQRRTTELAIAIAEELGLPSEKKEAIRMAGYVHDIGKISTPSEILSKPTRLSDVEFLLIKGHAEQGYEILKDVQSPWCLARIVHQHHERLNGSGYPKGLKGEEILVEARILAVADVVESMASHRPYRPALGIEAALGEIEKNRGILYDPDAADACLRLFREGRFRL